MNSSKTQISMTKIGQAILSLTLNLALFVGILFSSDGVYQILAKPSIRAEASPYQLAQVNYSRTNLDEPKTEASDGSENLIDNAREKLQETAETVREKLNLDEPISPSTKAFAEDIKEKVTHPLSEGDPVDNRSNWGYPE
ncbi:MAG: hypothetical protein NW220_07190 [Leptolyngbyaceae cyanobacterium bins.349]|nr:hypothetical protein [Leptolyngbyaceae cyanobacterium bins.349]